MSDTHIPLAGVIGDPISHSKSPRLHEYWLEHHAVIGHYVPLHVRSKDLEQCLKALPKLGFVGVNVTIPHKEAVMSFAQSISDRAAMIGAANTLTFRPDGTIYADNTDGYGFIENIRDKAPEWSADGGAHMVIGAGGAARAVVAALIQEGAPEIHVTNRTKIRAENLKAQFGNRITVIDWDKAHRSLSGMTSVINTTSVGLREENVLPFSLDGLDPGTLVNDLVYVPLETFFLQEAKARGATVVDGLGMLLHQGKPGFERWFGRRPEVTEALRDAVLR